MEGKKERKRRNNTDVRFSLILWVTLNIAVLCWILIVVLRFLGHSGFRVHHTTTDVFGILKFIFYLNNISL